MTSPKQIAANRRNALHSTGPRTPEGKAIVSQNPARHGRYAASPVIHGLESHAAWDQHHASTIASLAPVGQVELELAERVALILWRLKRVTRYERDVTSSAHSRAFDDLNAAHLPIYDRKDSPSQIREKLSLARTRLRALTQFADMPPATPLSIRAVEAILDAIDEQLEDLDIYTVCAPEVAPHDIPWLDVPDWTVERLHLLVAAAARRVGRQPDQIVADALAAARAAVNAGRTALRPYTRLLAEIRRARILPQSTNTDHLIRYESHLTRQLEKTLAQLRALQRARPAPARPDHATGPDHATALDDAIAEPARSGPAPLAVDYEAANRWLAAHPLPDEQ